nr:hypothetical protein [Tanacetum cinerariifolium]
MVVWQGENQNRRDLLRDNPLVSVEVLRVTSLEKEVTELKKNDPLNTQVTALVDEHLESRLGAIRDEFMSYLSTSITARITEQVKSQLPQILPKEVSNFAPPVIKFILIESLEHAVLAKESSQPKSTYEAASLRIEFELKKILIDKIDESQSYLIALEHRECCDRMIKSYDLDKSLFSTYDKVYSLKRSQKDKDKDGSDRGLKTRKTSKNAELKKEPEFEVADSDIPQDQEENPGNDDEELKGKVNVIGLPNLNDFKNPLILIRMTERLNNKDLLWLMTLASSADKQSKTFDELMSTPIDFSAYIINGLKITNLTQETLLGPSFKILKGTRSNYAELESMVIQRRVKDLQLGVESYQKKINVTKPKTTRPNMRKKDPFTPYQDPQGFIYVDTLGRNRLMRSDKLYKFSDGTLTRPQTLLNDITKNILIEYLPQKRWSTLEKKRANIIIKVIDKHLKERRITRSLKKFVGGRHYRTDL